jgi:glycosyltransferase involved in cell wall biosynthesis
MKPVTVTLFDDAPVFGGAERYLEILATGFDPREVAPRVVLAREAALDPLAARLLRRGIPVARLSRVPTMSAAGAFLSVLGHLAVHRTRVLHFNLVDPRACNGAIVAARLAGHSAIVATNQLPHSPFDDLPTPWRHRFAMKAIRRHVVVSEANAADLAAAGVDRSRISVIHNAAEDPGPATAARRAAARAALGIRSGEPVVGFSGRLVAQKDPASFVEAAAQVAAARRDARFVVIGDGPERTALETDARRLGIADRIAFLGHRDDALELYAGLDLLVLTSRYEGLPFIVLEAMGLGIPVVAPRIAGMDEAVADGVTGRLVDGGGLAPLAAAIADLIGRPDAREAMGRAASARALERFSPRDMVRRTVELYARLLADRG